MEEELLLEEHKKYMEMALEEARKAYELDETPIGAIIVHNGEVIAKACNRRNTDKNSLAHAEVMAIDEACKYIGDWRLEECTIYITLEPCPMCAGAILQSRISRLYIGTFNKDMGACGSVVNLVDNRSLNSFVNVIWTYDERCSDILKKFFDLKRNGILQKRRL